MCGLIYIQSRQQTHNPCMHVLQDIADEAHQEHVLMPKIVDAVNLLHMLLAPMND